MITAYFNPDYPELVFPLASFFLYCREKYPNETVDIIPLQVCDINHKPVAIKKKLDEEYEEISTKSYFNESEELDFAEGEQLYALFGIHPTNELEEKKIFRFFDRKTDKIILWLDWHEWPNGLVEYLRSQSSEICIDEKRFCLDFLAEKNYPVQEEWFDAEFAMVNDDYSNKLASRYLKILSVVRASGQNLSLENGKSFIIYSSVIEEIINGQKIEPLSEIEGMFNCMVQEVETCINSVHDNHHVFVEAKNMGRPVGYLELGRVEDYFNAVEIFDAILPKFPWLCVIQVSICGIPQSYYGSLKFEISDLIEKLKLESDNPDDLLKLLNAEIVRYVEA